MYVPNYTHRTPSIPFARVVYRIAHKIQHPGNCDHETAIKLMAQCDKFLRDPDNDCLRARGDWRWDNVNEAYYLAQNIVNPF